MKNQRWQAVPAATWGASEGNAGPQRCAFHRHDRFCAGFVRPLPVQGKVVLGALWGSAAVALALECVQVPCILPRDADRNEDMGAFKKLRIISDIIPNRFIEFWFAACPRTAFSTVRRPAVRTLDAFLSGEGFERL